MNWQHRASPVSTSIYSYFVVCDFLALFLWAAVRPTSDRLLAELVDFPPTFPRRFLPDVRSHGGRAGDDGDSCRCVFVFE